MGPSGCITHVIGYIGYIGYIALFGTGICRFCIWVELPVQRRLCPIFVRNAGSPDIHECFRGLTGSQRTLGIGVSLAGRPVSTYFSDLKFICRNLIIVNPSLLHRHKLSRYEQQNRLKTEASRTGLRRTHLVIQKCLKYLKFQICSILTNKI